MRIALAKTPRRLLLTLFASAFGCHHDPPESTSAYFFVDHAQHADVSRGSGAQPQKLWDHFTFGYTTRRALTPGLPSRIGFELRVPPDPVLRFATAASTMGRSTLLAPVEFRLLVDSGGREKLVFTATVRRSQPNQWTTHEVDLSPWAGSTARLVFETRRGRGGAPSAEDLILPLWGNPVLVSRAPIESRSHLILISVDCLRTDHLGAYGYERDTSPRIDELAREAALFRTAMSTSSYTLPTHASMLTGLPPSIHGADRLGISASVPYLPELLAEAGYRANAAVSAPFLSPSYGFHRGFHTYRNMLTRAESLVNDGLAMLREGYGQNQFLFLHLMDPHWTYSPPEEFITRFRERPRDISGLLARVGTAAPPTEREREQIIALYDAEIAYVDQQLGRFFEELKRMDLYDNSLIILTADHGEAFYEHGKWEHSRPWRSDGPGLYEEVVHIPLIVKWPKESAAVEIPNVVSQLDIFPTILEAAGLEPPHGWATSLRRYVDGGSPPPHSRRVIAEFISHSAEDGAAMQIAFRDRDYKYMASFRAARIEELFSGDVVKEELYDLGSDPGETRNLLLESADPRPYREALRAYLREPRERLLSPSGEAIVLDESVLEELKALGYVEPEQDQR